jgi:hypothetical protein
MSGATRSVLRSLTRFVMRCASRFLLSSLTSSVMSGATRSALSSATRSVMKCAARHIVIVLLGYLACTYYDATMPIMRDAAILCDEKASPLRIWCRSTLSLT